MEIKKKQIKLQKKYTNIKHDDNENHQRKRKHTDSIAVKNRWILLRREHLKRKTESLLYSSNIEYFYKNKNVIYKIKSSLNMYALSLDIS